MASSTIKKIVPDSIGAVAKSGDTMTGDLALPHLNMQSGSRYTNIHLRDSNSVPRGQIWSDGESGRIFFRSINPNVASGDVGSYYTEYYLYQSSLTDSSVSYKIYSERDTIPVNHGGTGATTPAAARTNLEITPANIGALPISGGTMTGSINFSDSSSHNVGGVSYVHDTNGTDRTYLIARTLDGSSNIQLGVKRNGDNSLSYHFTDPAQFRQDAGITPANIGAVAKTGDTMSGNLTTSGDVLAEFVSLRATTNPALFYKKSDKTTNFASIYGITSSQRLLFREWTPNTNYYEDYYLPAPTSSSNDTYGILTTKIAVNVAQGGTGATSAYDAAENLGLSMAFNGSDWTLATMYPKMSKVPVPGSVFLWLSPTSVGLLSGNAISGYCSCVASTTGSGKWRFMSFSTSDSGDAYVYIWNISGWTSTSATPTIGAIRRVAVPQTKNVTATTDTNGNISLGLAAASYHVLSAKSSSRIVTPWVSGDGDWHARVTGVGGGAVADTSVTVTAIYTSV